MDVGLVCDACSALTPIGVPQCARCGEPVALDPRPKRVSKQPPASNGTGVECTPPNSYGACENGYRESILQFDLSLPDGAAPSRTRRRARPARRAGPE